MWIRSPAILFTRPSGWSYWTTAGAMVIVLLVCLETQHATGQQIIGTKEGTWRSATVFTHAIWNQMLFYGGGSGSGGGDPRHEIEIGVFHLRSGTSASSRNHQEFHDPGNPIIKRAQFGLNQPGRGITPLSILESDGTLYMFCTSRPKDDLQPCIVVITASVEEPLNWGNYRVVVDSSVSGCANNHGASAIINPDDSSEALVYFAACSPPDEYRILLATVPIDQILDRQSYKLEKSYDDPVLKRIGAKANYPFVRYDAVDRIYELWYSGHSTTNPKTRACFVSKSESHDSFEAATEPVISPSGDRDRNDRVYATGPKVYRSNVYYSGRKDRRGNYVGIFRVPLDAPLHSSESP